MPVRRPSPPSLHITSPLIAILLLTSLPLAGLGNEKAQDLIDQIVRAFETGERGPGVARILQMTPEGLPVGMQGQGAGGAPRAYFLSSPYPSLGFYPLLMLSYHEWQSVSPALLRSAKLLLQE